MSELIPVTAAPIDRLVITTCPRDCYDGCGITVDVHQGAVKLVKGNRDHPSNRGPLCAKCATAYNGAWIDPEQRLLKPLRRIGPKGEGRFVPITWDEALEEIATELRAVVNSAGPGAIHHTHYTGTCSMIAGGFPMRFFEHLGAAEVTPDTICNNAGHVAWDYVFGSSTHGFDPRTVSESRCIMVWGANPSASAPHVDKLWLHDNDATVIMIDPVRHPSAEAADLHLQVRPGTDAKLAFALTHVMKRDGLLDMDFIDANVVGFDQLEPTIDACTPAWAEIETGVPAGQIELAANAYGPGPSLLWLGQGLQRQPTGGNIFRAAAMLPALTGNIGKPGAGAYYLNATLGVGARGGASPRSKPEAVSSSAPIVSQMDMPALLNDPETVRAYLVWNCNPLASNPAQAQTRAGLGRDDLFTVVVDCFMTDTADYADIVLPAASFLEFDDLNSSYFHLTIGPQVKCVEPMGSSLPNQEIFRRLARAMGFTAPELFEDDQSMIDAALQRCGPGLTWAELKQRGWASISDEPLTLWSNLDFATPSGKIELASSRARDDGHPYTPEPNADPAPKGDALRLLSPADHRLMNSSYGNDPRIGVLLGRATVTLHPDDAADRNIAHGDPVIVANAGGQLDLIANVVAIAPRGTAIIAKSRWPKHEPSGANVNLLHLPHKTDMGESTSVHGVEVTVRKPGEDT